MLFILIAFLFQSNNSLDGKWEQFTNEDKGVKEIIEFKADSVAFIREFFSGNFYKIDGKNLKVINDKNEKIVESKFFVSSDTLFLIKKNGKDRMFRITPEEKSNKIIGTWIGKTDKGIKTYFTFLDDKNVMYKAVIDEKKYKYKKEETFLFVFIEEKPAKLTYIIKDDFLVLIYPGTNEKFKYKRSY